MSDAERAILTGWADLILSTFAAAGVSDAVVSPGSRSTPFALAAERESRLEVHSVLDERAAGFFALGIARAGGLPLLICTSGSAPGHYLPAVMEASEAGLPLLVLSADRPPELMGCGAPQSTDQVHLFGRHARWFADLPVAEASPRALLGARRTAMMATQRALWPEPGPVHVNARARKPLEPTTSPPPPAIREVRARPVTIERGRRMPDVDSVDALAAALRDAPRPACVAGPLPIGARSSLAPLLERLEQLGVPLLAEASSQLRFVGRAARRGPRGDAFDRWIEHGPQPSFVLEIGGTPTSAAYARWLERGGPTHRFLLAGARPRDPIGTADRVLLGDLELTAQALAERLSASGIAAASKLYASFRSAVSKADAEAFAQVETALGTEDVLHEGAAVRTAIRALPQGALLGLGNSLPIRHADRFVPADAGDVDVVTQRGLNGIDGWIAGAAGIATKRAATHRATPALFVLGDVAFCHDLSSLALCRGLSSPLVLLVLDNGGGRIFEQLPIAQMRSDLSLFTTPPAVDLAAAAQAFGVGYQAASDAATLRTVLEVALETPGTTVVRAEVPPHGAAQLEQRIQAGLGGRVSA